MLRRKSCGLAEVQLDPEQPVFLDALSSGHIAYFFSIRFQLLQFDDEEEEEKPVQNQSSCLKGCGRLQGGHELTAEGRAASCRVSSSAGAVVASFPLPAELRVPTASCDGGCHLGLRPCPMAPICQLPAIGRHLPS